MSQPFKLNYTGGYRANFVDETSREWEIRPDIRNSEPIMEISIGEAPPRLDGRVLPKTTVELTPKMAAELAQLLYWWATTGEFPPGWEKS